MKKMKGFLAAAVPAQMTIRRRCKKRWRRVLAVNTDRCGRVIISLARQWACLMEARMATGDILEACAREMFVLADNKKGVTSTMYTHAVFILSQVWIHGERLRRWHNSRNQIGHEGERANKSGGVRTSSFLFSG